MGVLKQLKTLIAYLRKPAVGWSVLSLGGLGIAIGVVAVVGFEASLSATSTEKFCISCHEMYDQPYQSLKNTAHYNNRYGVTATCSDCHVPHEFIPKMIRKIEAAREVYGHVLGTIDTPAKYAAHLDTMKQREIKRLRANDSQECRNCHDETRMNFALQTAKAQEYHQSLAHNNKTCIDCHQGIAHDYDEGDLLPARR